MSPSARSFLRYALAMAANYPLTIALLFVMCDLASLPIVVAVPSATLLTFCWNFVVSRWAIVAGKTPAGLTT
jgi:putative flippase GtrA